MFCANVTSAGEFSVLLQALKMSMPTTAPMRDFFKGFFSLTFVDGAEWTELSSAARRET
jgi:hypothetical protein